MANILQFGSPRRSVRALSELTGLPEAQSAKLVDAIYARKPGLKWLSPSGAILAFLGWMSMFGWITDALEGTRWDILAFPEGALLLGYGVAISLAVVVGGLIPRAVMRRQLLHHLCSPACFWCGYSLKGLQRHNATIDCPECGKPSPVRRANECITP